MIYPIGSMYAIYGNIYHQYTPNVSIYTIHGSYGCIYIYIHICKKIAKLLLVLPAFSLVIESPVIGITTDLPGLAPSSDSPEKRAMRIEGCFFDRNVYIYIFNVYDCICISADPGRRKGESARE